VRLLVIVATLLWGGTGLSAQARDASAPAPPSGGTQGAFEVLSGEAQNGSLFPRGATGGETLDSARAAVEREIGHYHLLPESRLPSPTEWGGVWSARDEAGYVSVSIWTPDEYDRTKDHAVVLFEPARKDSLAPEELSELLAASESTESEGDLLDVSLPWQKAGSGASCSSQTILTVRETNGALVKERLVAYCAATAP
jgi:hypothetical protein